MMMNIVREAYGRELQVGLRAVDQQDVDRAFHHLARAHILSQRSTLRHVHVHWLMLKLGWTIGDWREVSGQMTRIVAAALFSRIWVPAGNTGRANVSAMRPMPVPDDLRVLLDQQPDV